MTEKIREALYNFISFYTQDELEKLDMRFVADKYIEEEYENKNTKWCKSVWVKRERV